MDNKRVDDIIKEEVNKEAQLIFEYFKDQIEDKDAIIMIQSVSIVILLFLLLLFVMSIV